MRSPPSQRQMFRRTRSRRCTPVSRTARAVFGPSTTTTTSDPGSLRAPERDLQASRAPAPSLMLLLPCVLVRRGPGAELTAVFPVARLTAPITGPVHSVGLVPETVGGFVLGVDTLLERLPFLSLAEHRPEDRWSVLALAAPEQVRWLQIDVEAVSPAAERAGSLELAASLLEVR